MAADTWSSVEWATFPADASKSSSTWYKHAVPYKAQANALQNVEIWIPSTSEEPPKPDELPERPGVWIIYIHGGAWRDPLVDSTSFKSPVEHIINDHPETLRNIAGIASINYSLSAHPHHPTHPSPPKDPNEPIDSSRQAKHPDHIVDVLTGLAFLQLKANFGSNYVLLGHSCGATLAFQVAANHSRWGGTAAALKVARPKVVIGLNGIYDLPELIAEPDYKHAQLKPIYENFTRLAFGDDEKLWRAVSPISIDDWSAEWSEGVKAVLVQSKEDALVPYNQTDHMLQKLRSGKTGDLSVEELEAGGDHNDLWTSGGRIAEIISIVVRDM